MMFGGPINKNRVEQIEREKSTFDFGLLTFDDFTHGFTINELALNGIPQGIRSASDDFVSGAGENEPLQEVEVIISGSVYCPECGWAMWFVEKMDEEINFKVRCNNPDCRLFAQLFWGPTAKLKRYIP